MLGVLELFTRRGCHLCTAAEQILRQIAAEARVELILRDIDSPETDSLLRAHYDHAVPVVHVNGRQVAAGRVEREVVLDALCLAQVCVCVLAKYPTPGKVKTRLTTEYTPEQAAGVHGVCLLHLLGRFRKLGVGELILAYDPPEKGQEFARLVSATEPRLFPQSRGDLGDRLASVCETLLWQGSRAPILFFGTDAPDVPDEAIHAAARHVVITSEPVLGPTTDGGYWTLGIPHAVPLRKILHAIPWSSGGEYLATVEHFAAGGYRCGAAQEWEDVDHPPDLRRLVERLRQSSSKEDRQLCTDLLSCLGGV